MYNKPHASNLIIIDQRAADYFLPCEKNQTKPDHRREHNYHRDTQYLSAETARESVLVTLDKKRRTK